jgi:hypothetical protein
VEYEAAELAIQSIENKGDGVVVVRLNAAPDADKASIHRSFNEGYQVALQEAEARYKEKLQAKDEQIQIYRQQNADMLEITRSLANRPVQVQAIAHSKAMPGNDQSQTFNVGGDFAIHATNSVVNLRDISGQVSNQIHQLPNSLPETADLKHWLAQLQAAIEAEPDLKEDDKADALTQVGELAKAGQNPQEGGMKKLAKQATTMLKGITAGLSEASKLAIACKDLLPLITGLFGL